MHLESAQPFAEIHDDVHRLLRIVGQLRWRLGLEGTLILAIRGVIACSLVLIALSTAAWLTGNHDVALWVAAAPAIAAILLAILRWPSRRDAAVAADRRLGLEERLATAVELLDGRSIGRFDSLQIRDAAQHAAGQPGVWLAIDRGFRTQAAVALLVAALGAGSLLLPRLPRPALLPGDATPGQLESAVTPDPAMRTLPDEASDVVNAGAQPIQRTESGSDLTSRVQQEQAERSALDTLAKALGSVSAGQPASDAIQQGDYASARDQLRALAEEADQLSDAAKQQLARALQQAASTTTQADRQLADRERQAAQALKGSTYADQRSALRGLADQVERSGARSVPADQLQRDLGLLQQQRKPSGDSGAPGQPGGAGVGTTSDPNVFGDPSRLDTAGQIVQVPLKLGGGPGSRPADGSEDQTAGDLSIGSRNVSELSQSQQTGQVAPEQNLVPGEQRPVVRGYFR